MGRQARKETLSFSTGLWEIFSGLLFLCYKATFPLQVSSSDNLCYGTAFSQAFVGSPERSRGDSSSPVLMDLHNNEAGGR